MQFHHALTHAASPSPFRTSRRTALRGLAAFGLAGLTAQRATAQDPILSMLEMRRQSVMVQEWDLSCGAAALGTLLKYQFGQPVDERELVSELIRRDIYIENPELVRIRQGFSLLDLKRVVEGRGFVGLGYGDLDLEDALSLAPVITPIDPNGYNHFIVLVGKRGDTLQLANPAFGNMTMSVRRFEKVWMELPNLGHVGFVVRRPGSPAGAGNLTPDPRVFMTPPPAMIRTALSR